MEVWSSNGLPLVDGDDLLNFSLDVEEKQNDKNNVNFSSLSSSYASGGSSSMPADEEEELEWLSNKDSFPVVEFDILDDKLDVGVLGQHSPVSVLESSPTGGNGNRNRGTNNWSSHGTLLVPGGFPNFARKKRIDGRKPRIGFGQHRNLYLVGHQINVVNLQKSLITPGKVVKNKASTVGRRCSHCGADQTPQWRAGPMGLKTLCNACGVRYKSGRLVPEYRPASSPTFSPAMHSNSHRKIMEIRRLKQLGLGQQ